VSDYTVCQPSPNGISAVTIRYLSRGASGMSAVRPYGISAVTIRHVSRCRTAEMPLKVGYTGRSSKAGLPFRCVFCRWVLQHDMQLVGAALPRYWLRTVVLHFKNKDKIKTGGDRER